MTVSFIPFELQDGYIHNWLSAGPQAVPVDNPQALNCQMIKEAITERFFEKNSGITAQPVERGPLDKGNFQIGAYTGHWEYTRCGEDHFIDHSTTCPTLTFLRSWAYTQLLSPTDQQVQFTLTSQGPVDVWINKTLVFHSAGPSSRFIAHEFQAALTHGGNKVLVRFAGAAAPDCVLVMALRAQGDGLSVRIPTLIPSIARRNQLEAINEGIYLDRDIYETGENIFLCWPTDTPVGDQSGAFQDVRLQTPSGRIYSQAEDVGRPGEKKYIGTVAAQPRGQYQAFIMPRAWEYYESNIRVTKTLTLNSTGRSRFSDGPYGTFTERAQEALHDATQVENSIFAEVAKMALGSWQSVEQAVIQAAVDHVTRREAGSEITLLGLLGMILRFGKKSAFPADIKEQVKTAAASYRFWLDEPGCDALQFDRENRQIVFHACGILTGQLFPTLTLTSGLTGRKLRERSEKLAIGWMKERGLYGFSDWNSKANWEDILTALAHLVDLAKAEPVWEMGSVLMDKIFYSIALNSFKGVYGVTQARGATLDIKGGLMEATTGITRLMWGIGLFNTHTAATVSLAMVEKYELPPIIADIAAGLPGELWGQEQAALHGQAVNSVIYRTPDYMLSAAQDYCPGQPGTREHIWQATLGTKAVVFVNHPGCVTQNDAHTPNFWLGNGVLPRVAQYKETLIALYNLPEDAWLGFTHAYFPQIEFDEVVMQGNTAFARKGAGYIALTAAQGLTMTQAGPSALRELRSPGRQNIWICQMGRANVDGDFAQFQATILAHPPKFDGLTVTCQTVRGETLTFGWDTPLTLNGEEQPLAGYPHFANPYTLTNLPASQMEIRTEDYLLRLNFGDLE